MSRLPVKKTYKLYIGGKFPRSESGRTYEVEGANVALGSRKDVRDAVRAARGAFPKWAGMTAYNRGQVLYRVAEMMEGRRAEFAELTGSDEEVDAFVRARAESAYHPSCTCKMGTETDPMAVGDAEARGQGVARLRGAGAPIMPDIVSGNLNAPTIMLAEKAADLIRGRPPLEPIEAPVYIAPDWETRQR